MKTKLLLALFSLGLMAVSTMEARRWRHWGYYPSYSYAGCYGCNYPSYYWGSSCCYY